MTGSMAGERSLEGRRALVTGAGIGIGRGIGERLAAAGARVAFHYHAHREGAEEAAAAAIADHGTQAIALEADLSDAAAARSLVGRAVAALGGLDIVVNNAGITHVQDFGAIDVATFDHLVAVNARAAFLVTQRALPLLAASPSAAVLNTISPHGQVGFPGFSAYAATKGALIALTKQLAIELAPQRIRVNAVGPGFVEVPRYFELKGYDPDVGRRVVPLGRAGTPRNVADAAVFLVSDAASYITGQVLFVDGGTMARMGFFWPDLEPEAP